MKKTIQCSCGGMFTYNVPFTDKDNIKRVEEIWLKRHKGEKHTLIIKNKYMESND